MTQEKGKAIEGLNLIPVGATIMVTIEQPKFNEKGEIILMEETKKALARDLFKSSLLDVVAAGPDALERGIYPGCKIQMKATEVTTIKYEGQFYGMVEAYDVMFFVEP